MSRFSSFGSLVHSDRGTKRIGVTPLKRCRFCRFANDTRTTAWSNRGEGNVQISSTEFSARAGCAFCGSMNWHPGKPVKLPDDRFLPSRENLKKRR